MTIEQLEQRIAELEHDLQKLKVQLGKQQGLVDRRRRPEGLPFGVGQFDSGRPDLAERTDEILNGAGNF